MSADNDTAINVHVEGEPGNESWEVWIDTEKDNTFSGTAIGCGASYDEARANAIDTLRRHITDLETRVPPFHDDEVDEEEDDDE